MSNGFAVKVELLREGELFIPAIQVHQDDCRRQHGCCRFERRRCYHLSSRDLDAARDAARSLASRIGVRADC